MLPQEKEMAQKVTQSGTFGIYWLDEYCIKGPESYAENTGK